MNTGSKIFLSALATYLLLSLDKSKASSPTDNPAPMDDEKLFFPPVENPAIRSDNLGGGLFGDNRGSRNHNGVDLIVYEGQNIYCPFLCKVERNTLVYGNPDPRWKGVVLRGINENQGLEVKIFYMNSIVFDGEFVAKGQYIGTAQAISEKFSPDMIDHIHIELRKNVIEGVRDSGQLVDPIDYFI